MRQAVLALAALAALVLFLVLSATPPAHSAAARIVVDGRGDDWDGVPIAHVDADGPTGTIDLRDIRVSNDERYLFVRFRVADELGLQAGNRLTLYVDGDGRSATGASRHGIGAEISWTFGSRSGTSFLGGVTRELPHAEIGLVAAPTVTSRDFEVAIRRDARPFGGPPLFDGTAIQIVLADETSGGDRIPDAGGIAYEFDGGALPPLDVPELGREDPSHLRLLSFNTAGMLRDSSRRDALTQIFRAISPDLISLQEIYDESASVVAGIVESLLPDSGPWHASKPGPDTVLASRFPIAVGRALGTSAGFLVEHPGSPTGAVLAVVLSAPCCDKEAERQFELDEIMAFVRDAKAGTAGFALPPGSPIALFGDANLVGAADQLTTLLEGAIANEARFGPRFGPDWDGAPFVDRVPRHTHTPLTFTWNGASFLPGRLDYVIYSASALEPRTAYVLDTAEQPEDALARGGLRPGDSADASDHLALVADFAFVR